MCSFFFKLQVLKESKCVPLSRTGIVYLLLWTRQKVQQTWSQIRQPPAKVALTQNTKIKRNVPFQKVQHSLPLSKLVVALKTSFYWGRVKWTPWSHRLMAYALHQVIEDYFNIKLIIIYNLKLIYDWPTNCWDMHLNCPYCVSHILYNSIQNNLILSKKEDLLRA